METLTAWRKTLTPPTFENAGRMLGVTAAQMFRYENGERAIPPARAVVIERVAGIPRQDLRPDIFGPAS